MIRGYAHYGLDANEYVEKKGIRDPYQPLYTNSPLHLESMALNNGNSGNFQSSHTNSIQSGASQDQLNRRASSDQVKNNQTNGISGQAKRPLPLLVPILLDSW